MKAKQDYGLTVTHLYGCIGLIFGVIGLVISFKGGGGIYGWLLLASGWFVSIFLSIFLLANTKRLTSIIENHDSDLERVFKEHSKESNDLNLKIGQLNTEVLNLKIEVEKRLSLADYLSSMLITKSAIPRRTKE